MSLQLIPSLRGMKWRSGGSFGWFEAWAEFSLRIPNCGFSSNISVKWITAVVLMSQVIECCSCSYQANNTDLNSDSLFLSVFLSSCPPFSLSLREEKNQWALSAPEDQRRPPHCSPNLINSSPYTLPVSHNSESIQFKKQVQHTHTHRLKMQPCILPDICVV